ncbi:hypothetical protein [Allocoleopsis franciscana]|uniref:Uncharacterized protein n=1 Tax=Allocoleopsis franciscana PCC 7113 TaxID=1173027 RepID=K9WPP7_9CYAN|nr:hypothetical protein [Allocoleopsis franciscana]AFZ21522.1 hypothetical protein Mic7113_5918 [Allocoleopsis franciscana PCC 7113]
MKFKFFILISAAVATVGLLEPLPNAFGLSLESQTNIKNVQPLHDVRSLKKSLGEWTHNQELVKPTKSISSLPVTVATPPTQSSQPNFARKMAHYINAFGAVFLLCVLIGYLLGELRSLSIKYRAMQVTVRDICVIGVFPSREAAGQALDQLVFSGFFLEKVFLVGKNSAFDEQSVDAQIMSALVKQSSTGLRKGLAIGKVSGGLIGLLLGLGILALLGVEQIALAPAAGFALVCGGICTVVGGVIGAFTGLRITKKQAKKYSERVARGDYLLIVNCTKDEIKQAKRILNAQAICNGYPEKKAAP